MKFIMLLVLLVQSSCAQLMKGDIQPVTQYRDTKTFRTTCSGSVEHWGSCFNKANKTCSNGYQVIEKKLIATASCEN